MTAKREVRKLVAYQLRDMLKSAYGLLGVFQTADGADEISLEGIVPVSLDEWVNRIEEKLKELDVEDPNRISADRLKM